MTDPELWTPLVLNLGRGHVCSPFAVGVVYLAKLTYDPSASTAATEKS